MGLIEKADRRRRQGDIDRSDLLAVGFVGRSKLTWDTRPPRDLRQGEEAIVVGYEDSRDGVGRTWKLVSLTRPRLIVLGMRSPCALDLLRYFEEI